ncbi:MAG: hypothetical protein AAF458_07740 [Pseudomonadota bacterium]
MDLAQFLSEAEALARPCTTLRLDDTKPPMAYLHNAGPGAQLASILDGEQWLNVFLDEEVGGYVEQSGGPSVSEMPLAGRAGHSLPPVDAVFLHGSDAVGDWLSKHDWPRDEPYNDNFPDPTPALYDSLWRKQYPLYQSGVAATLGGWHVPWPEGDWYDYVDTRLVLLTLSDTEPFVEVFERGGEFTVVQRIT